MLKNSADDLLRQTSDFAGAPHLVDVPGMSSPRVCQLLNRLVACMDDGEHYLEIGSWQVRVFYVETTNPAWKSAAADPLRDSGRRQSGGPSRHV